MGVPRNPVTPEPFCKQWKAETEDNPNISWYLSPGVQGGFGQRKKKAALILRIWPSSDQLPLLSPSFTERCTFASLQFGEDEPFQCVSSASEGVSSPGIPLKTIFLTPSPLLLPCCTCSDHFPCLTSSSITHYTHISIIWQTQGFILHLLLPLTARINTTNWVKVMTWRSVHFGQAQLGGQCTAGSCILLPGTVTSAPAEGALKEEPLLLVHRLTLNFYFSQL